MTAEMVNKYIAINTDRIMDLATLKTKDRNLLFCLFQEVDNFYNSTYPVYGDLIICMVLPVKKNICEKLGWKSTQTIDNGLHNLVKSNIIVRLDRGIYQLNPELFVKVSEE